MRVVGLALIEAGDFDEQASLEDHMTCPAVVNSCKASTTPTGLKPPSVRLPKLVQGVKLIVFRRKTMRNWIERYGRIFEFNVPLYGRCVVVSDPTLVRLVSTANAEELTNYQPNLGKFFGPGSTIALDGSRHHDRRRLLAPAFHGQSLKNYREVIEEETLRESENWPENGEFSTFEPMVRITLNVILRTIFGAEGTKLEELREIVPRYAKFASAMVKFMPMPTLRTQRYSPWSRLDDVRRKLDQVIFSLIERAEADPGLGERTDVLALLLRNSGTNETGVSRQDICDELVALIGAGHETSSSALSWAFERLRRHPDVLATLVEEVDEGGGDFRRATILEVLRVRPIIDLPGRQVIAPYFDLGAWRIPHNHNIFVSLPDLHEDPEIFPHPERFDPNRFRDTKQSAPSWLAFGNGARRCMGADFAINEIDTVLRTVLQNFRIHTDSAADEKSHFRGVAYVPKYGGRIVVTRRK